MIEAFPSWIQSMSLILGKVLSLQNTIDRYLKHTEGTPANGKVETGVEVHPIHSFPSLV